MFGTLGRMWKSRSLSTKTKVKIYGALVIPGPFNSSGLLFITELGRCLTLVTGDTRETSYLFQFSSIQFNSIQFNSIHFISIQFNSIQFSSFQFNSIQFNSIHFNSIQFNSIQFNSIQFKDRFEIYHTNAVSFTLLKRGTQPRANIRRASPKPG